jgi:hypothetical protein
MSRKRIVTALMAVLAAAATSRAADLSVSSLDLAPGETGALVVSGNIAGEDTFAIMVILEILPQGGNTGTVEFTGGACSNPITCDPVITDIVQLDEPWPGVGHFEALDTDRTPSAAFNASLDDDGDYLLVPFTFSGDIASYAVVASADASGTWDVVLATSVGDSWWQDVVTTLTPGTITVTVTTCTGPGDGDIGGDGSIDGGDIGPFMDVLLNNPTGDPVTPEFCASDMDESGTIDMTDLDLLVTALLGFSPGGACCFADGTCQDGLTLTECEVAGGDEWHGIGSDCGSVTCPVRPTNNHCADAEAIAGAGTFPFDNLNATVEGPFHPACGTPIIDSDVWFCWTADCDGVVRVDTCGQTAVDTNIAVYDGCSPCPNSSATLLACDDDDCSPQSRLLFTAVNGQSYLIRIGTSPGQPGGSGTFTVSCLGYAPGADDCANAAAISGEGTFLFDNSGATMDGLPDALCDAHGTQEIDHDVWYCWTSPCDGTVTLETCDMTLVDTKIAVYDGCSCLTGAGILACNDDACGLQTRLTFTAVTSQTYLIRVGVYPGSSGNGGIGKFSITCGGPVRGAR